MPLTRDKIKGFDSKSMAYQFIMLDRNRPIECSVSNAVFNYFEKIRYPTDNPDALFLRWRENIEKAISDKFDDVGSPDGGSINLFLKDIRKAVMLPVKMNGISSARRSITGAQCLRGSR